MVKTGKWKNDIFVAAVFILAALIGIALLTFFRAEGDYAIVSIDGSETERYSLSADTEVDIITEGKKVNRLVIENGKAYISYADCPDKICVSHRKISKEGETIICLPHKLVISIESEK